MQMGTICLTNGSQTEDPKVLHVRGQESTPVDTVNVTPDDWVKRDKRMIRLTGKHPFNAEARLEDLYTAGFLTPAELFYVRTHGATPKVDDTTSWLISIEGLVKSPIQLSLADLQTKFPVVTFPVTLVCAGNRRKEQNVVRKGLGFDWGAAGLSTALFTGVYLADLLEAVGKVGRPKHVIFEGADSLPRGPYGTSQRYDWSSDKSKGMLISWAMNGHPLPPDHGYPVRLVVPGQIGGRSVKWLKKIIVSAEESQHYLHFHDNKVLPTQVLPEQARKEMHWWYNQNYMINDLNVNSAIAVPKHGERAKLDSVEEYTIEGYAYAGGGRRVTRVEVSFDEGDAWTLADITYPEDGVRANALPDGDDQSFCWCFWSYTIPMYLLGEASAIMVRAMDAALALQPRDMYWNVLSMMNNWWFRVAIHKKDGMLQFEHPTLAGNNPGGWMERMKMEGKDILKPVFRTRANMDNFATPSPPIEPKAPIMIKPGINRSITIEELQKHRNAPEPWFIMNGEVYDATKYLEEHPGGPDSIMIMAGQDATEDFLAIHSHDAREKLQGFHIGTLCAGDKTSLAPSSLIKREPQAVFLSTSEWNKATLSSVTKVSDDTKLFRFLLDHEKQAFGLSAGQHIFVRLRQRQKVEGPATDIDGEFVQRAYTPVSPHEECGHVDLLVKIYSPSANWSLGGKMTSRLTELEIGEEVEMKGPFGSFVWLGDGQANWRGQTIRTRHVGMICGGSGITPIIQVLRAIFNDEEDTETEVWLVDANKTAGDILCREELDDMVSKAYGRFHLHHVLSRTAPEGWTHSKGLVTSQILGDRLPTPKNALLLACGPDAMIKGTVKPALRGVGWNVDTQLVVF